MGGRAEAASDRAPVRLGELALDRGLITAAQLKHALLEQARELVQRKKEARPLGAILVARGYVAQEAVDALLAEQVAAEMETYVAPRAPAAPEERDAPEALGKFLILREIGRGGMGVVYAALDTQLDRKVALKTLLTGQGGGTPGAGPADERFLREARVAANLSKHPNIVSVYEAGEIDGTLYLSMEFVEGLQMSAWRKRPSVPLRQQVVLLKDVALAVDHAHKHGIVHRDLKPANILVDAKNQPHVTDFGLAMPIEQPAGTGLTMAGVVLGTATHLSPEQAQGKKVDLRTDVWAMGVMLYEILTGRLPFRGETPMEIVAKVVRDAVPPPSGVTRAGGPAAVDASLEGVCLKALARNPAQRYATAKAFADDLHRWLRGEQVRGETRERKRPAVKAGAAAAAAAVLLLVVLGVARPWVPSVARELREAAECERQGRFEESAALYARALDKDPASPEAAEGRQRARAHHLRSMEEEADRLLAAGKLDDAAAAYTRILRLDPGQRKAAAGRSRAEQLKADREEAERKKGAQATAQARTEREVRDLEEKKRKLQEEISKLETAKSTPAPPPPSPPPARPPPPPPAAPPARAEAKKPVPERVVLRGHRGGVRAAAWSPQGKHLATGGEDMVVRVWDVATGQPVATLPGHTAIVNSVAFSPDGKWVASGAIDSTVRLWDWKARAEHVRIGLHSGQVTSVRFSPSGAWLASAGVDGSVILSEVPTGRERARLPGHERGAMALDFSPDGKLLAVGCADGSLKLWDPAAGRLLEKVPGREAGVSCVAFSADGRTVAATDQAGGVRLYDGSPARERRALAAHSKSARSVAGSPDGKLLATAGDDLTVKLWDAASGGLLATVPTGEHWIWGLAFSPDGKSLAGTGADWSVRIWEVPAGR